MEICFPRLFKFDNKLRNLIRKTKSTMKHKVVSDTGWLFDKTTSIVRRGILDYVRTITYDRILSKEELQSVLNFLSTDACPGQGVWLIHSSEKDSKTYSFKTVCDSSD
jgi:hypothetical protein